MSDQDRPVVVIGQRMKKMPPETLTAMIGLACTFTLDGKVLTGGRVLSAELVDDPLLGVGTWVTAEFPGTPSDG